MSTKQQPGKSTQSKKKSSDMLWLLQGLEVALIEKGGLKMPKTSTGEITSEYLIEVGKTMYEKYLPSVPIEVSVECGQDANYLF